jgi:predicted enzyme related to lactoylglutathione lyase
VSHRFVWVDIPVRELERAIAFYSAVLGSAVTREGGPGFTFGVLAHEGGEIAASLVPMGKDNAPSARGPLVYLNVDRRIAEAERMVVAHGGRVVQATQPIGAHGYRAIVIDSEGNRIALHSTTR